MATYNQVGYGSQGSSVTELQKLLNNNGYNLNVDGIFGSNTQAAVKDYQQKNGLAVDGIVGTNTWGALTKLASDAAANTQESAATTTPATDQTATTTTPAAEEANTGFQYGEYKPGDTVTQAEALLNQQLSQKPGEYQSQWQEQINQILQQITNREKFSYNLNEDAMYQQYADQYVQQGKLAMMDAMGQAQAMTGGYGNSWAQSAGQQAYQAYLQKLNEVVPELYGMALDQYNQEGQNLLNQFAILGDQEDKDYGRYMDNMNAWLAERDYLAGRYDTERDYDYGMWADGRDFAYGQFSDDRAYDYQVGRDKISDEQWQKEFDEAKRQFDQQYALKTSSSGGGGGSSGGGSSSSKSSSTSNTSSNPSGYNNAGYSTATVKQAQAYIGATADGMWGANSAARAKQLGYSSLSAVVDALSGIDRSKTTTTTTSKSTYSNWSAGTWEAYFAKIRQSEGQAAALEELNYFTRNGLIPQNMVTYASSGARGGNTGH